LEHGFGLGQARQPRLTQRDFISDDQPIGHTDLIGAGCQREQGLDFGTEVGFLVEQTLVADGFTLGGIRVDLGPIDADVTQFQHARGLSKQEHLDKEVVQYGQKGSAEGSDGIVAGVQVAGNEAEGSRLIGGSFNLARREDAGGIAIGQQAEEELGA